MRDHPIYVQIKNNVNKIIEGNHRVACCAALSYEIQCQEEPDSERFIERTRKFAWIPGYVLKPSLSEDTLRDIARCEYYL